MHVLLDVMYVRYGVQVHIISVEAMVIKCLVFPAAEVSWCRTRLGMGISKGTKKMASQTSHPMTCYRSSPRPV